MVAGDSRKSVLVIDDDPELLELVSLVLEVEGYRVATAPDGREALARIEREMPDLILLDMKMPVMNGWEFAREFRARYAEATPVVIITASADARQLAEEIDASDYIGKPFDVEQLTATVGKHTGAGQSV